MKKKQIVGAALYQYIIIVVLLGLGVVTVYSVLGNLIQTNLSSYNDQLNEMNKNIELNSNTKLKAGVLGGTPDKPVSKCSGSICTIDYGDFILSGIPSNFDDYIQAGGSSGGTDAISSLFDQIAEQMKEKGDTDGYEDFKSLANLGHYQAQFQKEFENKANTCLAEADQIDCMIGTVVEASKVVPEIPENISSMVPDFAEYMHKSGVTAVSDHRRAIADLGYARNQQTKLTAEEFATESKKYPSFNALAKLDQILEDPKYSDNLKNMTLALIENNQKISSNQEKLISEIICGWGYESRDYKVYDTLTGSPSTIIVKDKMNELTPVLHPQLSMGTNLNSSLVCVAGKNLTTGRACY